MSDKFTGVLEKLSLKSGSWEMMVVWRGRGRIVCVDNEP